MARPPSIADMIPMPAPRAVQSMAISMTSPPTDVEAAEPEVESVPPLSRAAFGYLEARPGVDGSEYFASCASCQHYVAEAFGRGAFRGDRCALFGSNFPVSDDDGCNRWAPWSDGQPDSDCIAEMAEGMVAGCRGSLSPWGAGYAPDKHRVCSTCAHFDGEESSCEFFGCLNEALPKLFAIEEKVTLPARCNGWSEIPTAAEYE